jgi:hypothetical protein
MKIVKHVVLASLLVLAAYGVSYAQTNPQPKTVVTKVKVKKVKPAKPIKNKDIQKAQTKLTTNEKTIQKANQKNIAAQQKAFRKSNQKATANFKAIQKASARNLRDQQKQIKKSQ